MLGKLSDAQIDHVLHEQTLGRIGCHSAGKVYVVPVTYVYHNGYIYAHSKEGLKVQLMRKNPNVCFQVDIVRDMRNWRSVILWGLFEEIKSDKAERTALNIMQERLAPISTSETVKASSSEAPRIVEKTSKAIIYRIKVGEKTGLYERH
jgi:uncharacterized protein